MKESPFVMSIALVLKTNEQFQREKHNNKKEKKSHC
jgi:hypothetical protein